MNQRTRVGQYVLGTLALVALPAICIWLTPNPLNVAGYVDPFFYTGYMVNFRTMVERYDITYYFVRMAVILPGRAIYGLFGPEHGFYILEYLKVLVGSTSIFLIARRFYGTWTAWFCAVFLCFSAWYLRSNTWDYVNGFALNYVLAGVAFLLVPRSRSPIFSACAGFCFALATNSNLYAFAMWVAFLPTCLIIEGTRPLRMFALRAGGLFAGFIGAYALLAVAVNSARPGLGFFFEHVAINMAKDLLAGGSMSWFEPLGPFIAAGNYQILTPVAIALGSAIFLTVRARAAGMVGKTRLSAAFLLYLCFVIVIYLINHFVFHSPRITLPYYFCYLVIPSTLMIMALTGELADETPQNSALLAAGTVALVVLWKLYSMHDLYAVIPYALLLIVFVLFLAGAALSGRWPTVALASTLGFAIAIPALFVRSSENYARLEQVVPYERDVYYGALHLIREVEQLAPPDSGPVRFWYASAPDDHWLFTSLTSPYLSASRLFSSVPPNVNNRLRKEIEPIRTVVILGVTRSEVERAVIAMHRIDPHAHEVELSKYSGRSWGYEFAIVRLR